jgi:membrane-associated PAP2 superfamily phosphatase
MINLRNLPQNKISNLMMIINLALIIISLSIFQKTDIDLKIQNNFYNFVDNSWIIDRNEPVKKFIFYQLPKILLGIAIISSLVISIIAFIKKKNKFYHKRYDILLIFIGLSLIPLIAGNVKKFTNIYCPNQLEIYGSTKPYVKIFDHYPSYFKPEKKGQCFPAGHVITAFTLYIFCFILKNRIYQIYIFFAVTILGWILGFYQILKGAHFISDTLVAMLLSFLLAQLIARIYYAKINEKI